MIRIFMICSFLLFSLEANDFRKGMLAYKKGDYNEAIVFLKSSVKNDKSVTAHYILGKIYVLGQGTEKKPLDAINLLEFAAQKGNIPANCYLADAYLSSKTNLEKIEDTLKMGLKRNIPYCQKVSEKYLKLKK